TLQAAMFMFVFSIAVAGMVAFGFLLEGALYSAAGWTHEFDSEHLYTSPWQVHLTFLESWVIGTLWLVGGFAIGAGFYRSDPLGGLAIGLGLLLAGVADVIAIEAYPGPLS